MKIEKLTIGAVTASVIAMAALAHGGATGIVKERMDGMGVMKEAVKVLTPMMQGQTAYDADVIRSEAAKIGDHAGEAMTRLFPEGSGGAPSETKDVVWEDWQEFAALAEQLRVVADGLELAAENGLMMAGTSGQRANMMGGSTMMNGSTMMGGGFMMGGSSNMMDFADMPADGVFTMLGQVCSACHTRFRAEK
ncbi:cytochrome c [Aliiroseovarius sp. F20344]|uniref:c-type cytochrome n=1 Tax=Aliiroseovarius sp. F20344 TaxID=2926414 RepID=UPI001FF416D8|nr:cytochrome c [Aliiroseovarius sp. F20344]MCK0141967.1 cytochrome c [Aliiroseovarius sp. F20344]